MEGQPRVRYEWRGGKRGVGVRSSRAVAAGKRPGKQRANTSGADLRAFEPLGYTAAAAPLFYTVALRVLRSCRRTVVAVDEPPLRSSALDAPPPLATRPAVLRARGLAGYPLAPSRGRGCDRLGGLIARRAKRGALPRVFTGASRSGGVRCVSPSPPPPAAECCLQCRWLLVAIEYWHAPKLTKRRRTVTGAQDTVARRPLVHSGVKPCWRADEGSPALVIDRKLSGVSWGRVARRATITPVDWYPCGTANSVPRNVTRSISFREHEFRSCLVLLLSRTRWNVSANDSVRTVECCQSVSLALSVEGDSSVYHEGRLSDKGTAASLDARILKAAPGGQPDAMRRRCWRKRAWMRLTLSTWVSF